MQKIILNLIKNLRYCSVSTVLYTRYYLHLNFEIKNPAFINGISSPGWEFPESETYSGALQRLSLNGTTFQTQLLSLTL